MQFTLEIFNMNGIWTQLPPDRIGGVLSFHHLGEKYSILLDYYPKSTTFHKFSKKMYMYIYIHTYISL